MVSDFVYFHSHSGSSENVSFTDLAPGKYVLRVAATNSKEDRAIERRRFEISSDPSFCTTHLINGGVTVSGDMATVEFAGTGPAETFRCKLDTKPAFACKTLHVLLYTQLLYVRITSLCKLLQQVRKPEKSIFCPGEQCWAVYFIIPLLLQWCYLLSCSLSEVA